MTEPDTHSARGDDSNAEQLRILRAMTPEQKLRAATRLYQSARALKEAALRAEHPHWSDEEVRRAIRDWFSSARS